jgi:hypothetical protein
MSVSMSAIWDESSAMIRRESHLMVPVALATVGIGGIISGLTQPETPAAGFGAIGLLGFIIGIVFQIIGNLAIIALTLMPGISVAESLRLAMSRLPKMIGISFLFLVMLFVMMIPAGFIVSMSGATLSADMAARDLPPITFLLVLLIGAVLIFFSARLLTLSATVVDRNPPIIEAIKSSFRATEGMASKIIGVALLYFVVTVVITSAVAAISGILFGMIGKALAAPLLGKGLTVLVTALVSAALSIIASVFAALLYRKLSTQ